MEVRLQIDYDADGTVDAKISPLVATEGEDLEGERPKVEPVVEETGQGQAVIRFLPATNSPEPAAIFYSLYPSHPELQMYSEPFVVKQGSFLLYGAVGPTGTRQPTRELEILGGITADVRLEASIDGEAHEVRTGVPGQNAVVTFEGERGQQVVVEVGPASGGIQPRNQATLVITDWTGLCCMRSGRMVAPPSAPILWSFELDLPSDGVYTIVIDPRLANVISTSVTLSPAS